MRERERSLRLLKPILVILLLLLLIACSPDKGFLGIITSPDNDTTSTTTSPDNKASDETTKYVIPFSEPVSTDRGLTVGTLGKDVNELLLNQKLFQSFPIIPTLKETSISSNDLGDLNIDEMESFGIKFTLNRELSSLNSDGVFLVFDCTDETSGVLSARIEYYYNTLEKQFTYREFALCTFHDDTYGSNDMVLVLELTDIPVTFEEDGSVSYQGGSLDESGTNNKNAFMDYIILNGTGSLSVLGSEDSNSAFWREYRLINVKNNIIGSFSLPWWSVHYEFAPTEEDLPSTLTSLIKDNCTKNSKLWDKDTMLKLNLEFAFKVMDEFYVTQHEEKKWTSYSDFKNAGYSEIKEWVKGKTFSRMVNELPVLANLKSEVIAPSPESASNVNGNIYSLSHLQEAKYTESNFDKFFGEYTKEKGGDFSKFLVTKYLNICGITNTNWIENFIYSLQTSDYRMTRFLLPVTYASPEEFKKAYEEAKSKSTTTTTDS